MPLPTLYDLISCWLSAAEREEYKNGPQARQDELFNRGFERMLEPEPTPKDNKEND